MKFFFIKDTIKKMTGIIVIAAGVLLLAIGTFGLFRGFDRGDKSDIHIGIIINGLALVFIIPGIRFYISGVKLSNLEKKLKQLATLIKTYRRISLAEIAKKFGVNELEAEKLLNKAIELDLVKGNMDRTTGEFFVSDSVNEIKKISFCPNCGASISQIIHKGETGKCNACGGLFS